MKQTRWIVFLMLVLSAGAAGDIVFTTDGREIEGEVTQADGVVTINTPEGQTIEVAEDDVIHIVVQRSNQPRNGSGDLPPDYNPPTVDNLPDEDPTSDPIIDGGSTAPRVITPPVVSFDLDKITRPDVIAFKYMRLIVEAPPAEAVELDQTLQIWQGRSHDQLRRIGTDWIRPDVFITKRENFTELLNDASDFARELSQVRDDDEDADTTRARLTRQLESAMLKAANSWADPEIRRFLRAVAHYQAGNYDNAADDFDYLRRAYPMVTAYHQGYGLATMEIPGQELEALAAFINALSLEPDSSAMLSNLLAGIENVPGHQVTSDVFQQARDIKETYHDAAIDSRRPQQLSWAMPTERAWLSRTSSLPVPPCDRIVYRQGWAIPVTKDLLLIDREVVRDAARVFIRLSDEALVPGTVMTNNSLRTYLPTMAMIRTREATFTPVALAAEPDYQPGNGVSFIGVGLYVEMGTDERSVQTTVLEINEKRPSAILDSLSAGEGATAVFDLQDQLVGFIEGKTDYLEDDGGDGEFIPISQPLANSLLNLAQARSSNSTRSLRKTIDPIAAEGLGFHVFAIATETFNE